MATTYFDDPHFQDTLLAQLCRDAGTLRECAEYLGPRDFKPLDNDAASRWRFVVAQVALEHYTKYGAPIGKLLASGLIQHIRDARLPDKQAKLLRDYGASLLKTKLNGVSSVVEKATQFQRERLRAQVIQELTDAQVMGTLDDARFVEITQRALSNGHSKFRTLDYFNEIDKRIERRTRLSASRFPLLGIDPLDFIVHAIGRRELGLIMAPYKRGKSLALLWIALAYSLQRLNVLYLTLEDPTDEVEDRMDAAITHFPMRGLRENSKRMKTRFERFRRFVRTRLKIIDGTQEGMSITDIERVYLRERDAGFIADAVFVDYDDEIVPRSKNKDRRFEFAEIYRDFRQFLARQNLLGWLAAQTQRGTEGLKILSADKLAEDISKVRKATFTLALGQGDWGEDSIYLWVAGHKHDKQHVGCNIMSNRECGLIYDAIATRKKQRSEEDADDELS